MYATPFKGKLQPLLPPVIPSSCPCFCSRSREVICFFPHKPCTIPVQLCHWGLGTSIYLLVNLEKKSYQTKIFAVDIGIFLFRFCYFSFILSLACVIHILCILLLACLSRIHEFALAYATISLTCI